MHSPFVRWMYRQLVTELSHKTVKSWFQQYWNLVFNSNGKSEAKIKLGILNYYIGSRYWNFPRTTSRRGQLCWHVNSNATWWPHISSLAYISFKCLGKVGELLKGELCCRSSFCSFCLWFLKYQPTWVWSLLL